MKVTVTSLQEGFRRAGFAWSKTPTEIDPATLPIDQVLALATEPMLSVAGLPENFVKEVQEHVQRVRDELPRVGKPGAVSAKETALQEREAALDERERALVAREDAVATREAALAQGGVKKGGRDKD